MGWTQNGTPNADTLIGTSSNDTFSASGGSDYVTAGAGDDSIEGSTGDDTIKGGDGNDTATFQGHYSGFRFTMQSDGGLVADQYYRSEDRFDDLGTDVLYDVENLHFWDTTIKTADLLDALGLDSPSGGGGDDDDNDDDATDDSSDSDDTGEIKYLYGTPYDDVLLGGSSRDNLTGKAGNDKLSAGSGNDSLDGGVGDDTLTGGDGQDIAHYGGNYSGFRFSRTESGALQVDHYYRKDEKFDDLGTDVLTGIETLAFWDATLSVTDIEEAWGLTTTTTPTTTTPTTTTPTTTTPTTTTPTTTTPTTTTPTTTTTVTGGVEELVGAAGPDSVSVTASGAHVRITGIETVTGGAGGQWVDLADGGATVFITGIETVIGGAGGDWINLGGDANRMTVAAIETLIGGEAHDVLTLGGRGNTMLIAAIEEVIGGAGTDRLTLGDRGNTLTVAGVETVVGGAKADKVTVASGGLTFQGAGGGDTLTLYSGRSGDVVVFAADNEGSGGGNASGCDKVTRFQSGLDTIAITGALAASINDDGDGVLDGASRATGAANLVTDELVVLTTKCAKLTDGDFASFRRALGGVTPGGAGDQALVLASDGKNTGLFVITDDGDGIIGATEVRLLAIMQKATLSA
ncbi:MAG: hypothetical protein HQL39_12770, partial [Alphaproteobacteria bacterium]|nr:hypothetical protein [Alphaproteobacteria bacterium]